MVKCPLDSELCNLASCIQKNRCSRLAYDAIIAGKKTESIGHAPIAGSVGMTLQEFQVDAVSTKVHEAEHLFYAALGLAGEAGEYADKVKKIYRGDPQAIATFEDISEAEKSGATCGIAYRVAGQAVKPQYLNSMALELGDVLWYLASAADDLGFTLEEIAQMNIEKRRARKKAGTLRGEGDNR